ncbi:MAG: universal stress protein, partial [Geobacteraceae bacterium]|nr:universal stress protein [Geobacteraceae bacterium]
MKQFKNILYVNEPNVHQNTALARAVSLAQSNHADLTVIDVVPTQAVTAGIGLPLRGQISGELRAAVESKHRNAMESMLEPFSKRLQIRVEVLIGKTYLEAIRAVLKSGYDLLIKPAEDPNWTDRLFGSDDLHLLRKCPCPVWLMKPTARPTFNNILATVDFDLLAPPPFEHELNREILELSASLALSDIASLHLVHAWEAYAERTILSRGGMSSEGMNDYVENTQDRQREKLYQLAEELRGWLSKESYARLDLSFHLPEGPAKKVILPLATKLQADLVV